MAADVVLAGVDDGEVGDNMRTRLESELDAGGDEEPWTLEGPQSVQGSPGPWGLASMPSLQSLAQGLHRSRVHTRLRGSHPTVIFIL